MTQTIIWPRTFVTYTDDDFYNLHKFVDNLLLHFISRRLKGSLKRQLELEREKALQSREIETLRNTHSAGVGVSCCRLLSMAAVVLS